MKRSIAITLSVVSLVIALAAQTGTGTAFKDGEYYNAELGVRYTPPQGMTDETADARETVRARAAAAHTTNTFDVLLRLVSGPDDAASDWHSVGIETYPRSKFGNLSDSAAEEKINMWAAGQEVVSAVGKPKRMSVAGTDFLVSEFEHSDPSVQKNARVFSTIRNGKLLVIAFTANASERLDGVAESIQTLRFSKTGK
ncbi:MAG TPA: hypothetical protein VKH18_17805 [Terriglobales bacterium]|nr:hypothetical protein [Terriglobales bacterium]